ncbi:hypothetical protein [Photorhabdus sp. SF281]|uniref:hypothetical protein n=1 Tax=Photorhabdus sp. SF281 TaxID=3459527 RepID=UPI004043DF96
MAPERQQASIAEFENDLCSQVEGIAKENGVRFGRPAKLTEVMRKGSYLWNFDWSVGKGVQARRSDNLPCFEHILAH